MDKIVSKNNIFIPQELILLILNYINDTKTYLNCRLVCKNWHKIFENVKIFNNYGNIHNIVYFKPNKILYFDYNNILKAQVIFYNYGYYKYIQYDYKNVQNLTIENKPFKLIKKKYINTFLYENTSYNIYNDKKTEKKTHIHPCLVM